MRRTLLYCAAASALVLAAGTAVLIFTPQITAKTDSASAMSPYTTWTQYGGSPEDAQYSALKQVNRSNVAQLKQVWFYPAGNNGFRYGSNPIIIGDAMYVVGKNNSVVALNAATGKQIWLHDFGTVTNFNSRGVVYWQSKDGSDRRILCVVNNPLLALNARTGKVIDSFGNHGRVDLRVGLGRVPDTIRQIGSQTPGRICGNRILEGSATGEDYESPPGDLRAYNVITGKMAWIFHTVPHPGEPGYKTWPPGAWKYIGGTNTWGEISLDPKTGIAYFPTGSPTYDFYGADRNGADLFSDCILAINARTGKLIWYYQTTHHDLWDYDLEVGPKLLTVDHDGHKLHILAEPGKNGFLYVLNRATGKPVWPIVERPVPKSDMPFILSDIEAHSERARATSARKFDQVFAGLMRTVYARWRRRYFETSPISCIDFCSIGRGPDGSGPCGRSRAHAGIRRQAPAVLRTAQVSTALRLREPNYRKVRGRCLDPCAQSHGHRTGGRLQSRSGAGDADALPSASLGQPGNPGECRVAAA